MEEDTEKGKDIQWIGKTYWSEELMLKCLYYPKWLTETMQSLLKFQWPLFSTEIEKKFYNTYGITKGHKLPDQSLRKNKAGGIILLDIKINYKDK